MVLIKAHHSELMPLGVCSDVPVRGTDQAALADMPAAGVSLLQQADDSVRDVLIEQQHQGTDRCMRSRRAAKARQAMISSSFNSGKSLMIARWLIPLASQPSTSSTAIRVPRTQGRPKRFWASMVMREAVRADLIVSNISAASYGQGKCAWSVASHLVRPRVYRALPHRPASEESGATPSPSAGVAAHHPGIAIQRCKCWAAAHLNQQEFAR